MAHTVNCITSETNTIYNAIQRKKLTDKQVNYIIQSVLHPAIEYRTKSAHMPGSAIKKITNRINTMFRHKANLSRSTGCKTIHHPDFYNIPPVEHLLFTARTTELVYDLNSPFLEGTIVRTRLAQFQRDSWTMLTPLARPTETGPKRKFWLFNGIRNSLAKHKCSIIDGENKTWTRPNPQDPQGTRPTIEDKLGPYFNYSRAAFTLRNNNLMFFDQLFSSDNGDLIPYSRLKLTNGQTARGRTPEWYNNIKTRWDGFTFRNIPDHQNRHPRNWKFSTEVHEDILVITPLHYLAEACGSVHTDIAQSQEEEWIHQKSALNTAAQAHGNELTFYTDGFLARNTDDPFHPVMGAAWYNTETGLSG